MKKFWNLMLAALVIIGAAACTENYENIEKAEGFSFYAEVVNDGTRAYIADEDGDKTWETKWELGDKLYVNDTYEFVCTDVEKGKFTCDNDEVATLVGQRVTITTDGNHSSYDGYKALYTTAEVESFGANAKIPFQALTSFFRFTFNGTGNIKLALSENKFRNDDKSETNEITLKGASGDIFLAFWPGEELKSSLALTINGKAIKAADDLTFKQGKVYNLGTFDFPYEVSTYSVPGSQNNWTPGATPMYVVDDYYVAYGVEFAATSNEFKILGDDDKWLGATSLTLGTWTNLVVDAANIAISAGSYDIYFSKSRTMVCVVETGAEVPAMPASTIGLVGSFQGWDALNPVAMTYSVDGWVVAENIELYRDDAFKFIDGKSWDVSFGGSSVFVAEDGKEYTLVSSNSQNIKVAKNGKFNLYFNPTSKAFKYDVVEEYTDLMVNITIDNKANWSPLSITLKNGNTTIVNNATVTNNKYAVSGNYIGESLSYVLSNGSKTMKGNVSITKTGATITLEETVIKLTVKLDDSNSQKYWGNTMKIHAWGTGTSFDTSWPGNTMTSEGNYTWSITVPSELVGKTINFLVHNGNGWQSPDSKVTIKAEGNTLTSTGLGIK